LLGGGKAGKLGSEIAQSLKECEDGKGDAGTL